MRVDAVDTGRNAIYGVSIATKVAEAFDEIRAMRRESDMELEIFIHGALCCSLSGQCLFSSWLGGASGNRGRCKQPCRRRFFHREGNDLICEVPVPFGVAALGGKLDVPTISGKATIVIPKGSQFGRVLRLAGKGAPSARRGGARGDLHVRLIIETPVNLSKEQQTLLEKFAASLDKSNTPVQNAFVENAGSFLADKE